MKTNYIVHGDCIETLEQFEANTFQLVIADPPYFQVLLEEGWDNQWRNDADYLDWSLRWIRECKRVMKDDGLLYIFGQLGKREHIWLHVSSLATKELQFHDMIIWDRAIGYNERYDSFTPCYEMILALRKSDDAKPYFNKDAVRLPYNDDKIQTYLRDKRYKDKEARLAHLEKGKYATNILRVPSLKGSSKEKAGHPSQKPMKLIEQLILSSSRPNDVVLDLFSGSGTTALLAEQFGRKWIGIETNKEYIDIANARLDDLRRRQESPLFKEA